MGDDSGRIILKIIRRQPIIFLADERFEETPGLP